jgi:hypothetical protein
MADTVTTARGVNLIGISSLPIFFLVDERPEILIDQHQFDVVERTARLAAGKDCASSACDVRTGANDPDSSSSITLTTARQFWRW